MEKWKNVVIRPATKGSKFFVLDREDYAKPTLVHLNDKEYIYGNWRQNSSYRRSKLAITNWYEKYADGEGMTNAIIPNEKCKPGDNYLLLKAHKPEQNYPGRLISTGCTSDTKALSE